MADSTPEENDGTPRWVKVSGIIGSIVVLLVLIMLFTGHGPGRHLPSDNPTAEDRQ